MNDYEKYKFSEWMKQQKDYGLCNPPMDAQTAIDMLFYYLNIDPDPNPESQDQVNTYIVDNILYKYSKLYRKEVKEHREGITYIFLDVDGVLNNKNHYQKLHKKYGRTLLLREHAV